jgi:hypothetical protein
VLVRIISSLVLLLLLVQPQTGRAQSAIPALAQAQPPSALPSRPPPSGDSSVTYQADGQLLRILAGSAPDAPELSSTSLPQAIRKIVSFRGLLIVAFAPRGVAVLDARTPGQAQVLGSLPDLDVRSLELQGSVLHYSSGDGQPRAAFLPVLLEEWGVNRSHLDLLPGGEARCSAPTGDDPAGPIVVRVESTVLIVGEQRRRGRCWLSALGLPGAIVLAGSHGSSVYLAGPSGELWVVDLMQPDQPKLALSLNTYCSPKALTLSPAGDELRLVTTAQQLLRVALPRPLEPKLLSEDVVAACRAARRQGERGPGALASSAVGSQPIRPQPHSATRRGKLIFGVGLAIFVVSYVPSFWAYAASQGQSPGYLVPGSPFYMAGEAFVLAHSALNDPYCQSVDRGSQDLCKGISGFGGALVTIGGLAAIVWGLVQTVSLGATVAGINEWATASRAQRRQRASLAVLPSLGPSQAGWTLSVRY